ncbi:HAMP domain-containing protein [Acetobacteraceae bacterium H6797]|nr:HAMP domain-containing protein [Acetobacteraceae bacterium H6797]
MASAGFRFALLFASLFAVAGLAFSGMLWWGTAGALDRQTDAAIRADSMALAERFRDGGRPGVVEAIAERIAVDAENDTLYLLTGRDGTRYAGNLNNAPQDLGVDSPWFTYPLLLDGVASEARLLRTTLPNGDIMLVGRDVGDKLELRALLTEAIIWSSAAAAVFALIGALLLRNSLEKRLLPTYATAAAIAAGDMSHRVPLSGRKDEFDRLAESMNTMLDRIAYLMEGVRGVSDAIAHDLRTPIARARAKLEYALNTHPGDGQSESDALRAAIEQGIADLDGITRIFQAVLRIAEAEAGSRRAAFAPLDLAPLLEDAADLYGASAEERGQQLQAAIEPALTMVGDRDLLLQAVANLLDNAVKFSPPEAVLRLEARREEGAIEISVIDAGPGLSAAERMRAGERFFRADGARTTPGSGLGLSLVRAVAGLHQGDLVLEDARPGQQPPGLKATLRLPG